MTLHMQSKCRLPTPASRFRRASASFQAIDEDELSFEAGDIVEIQWEHDPFHGRGWLWGKLAFPKAGWRLGWCDHPFGLVPAFLLDLPAQPSPLSPQRSLRTAAAAHLQKVWVGWKRRGRRVGVWPWEYATQEKLDRVALLRTQRYRREEWMRMAEEDDVLRGVLEEDGQLMPRQSRMKDENDVLEEGEEDKENGFVLLQGFLQAFPPGFSHQERQPFPCEAIAALLGGERWISSISSEAAWTHWLAIARAYHGIGAERTAASTCRTSKRPPPLPPLTLPLPSPSPSAEVLDACVCPITAEIMTDPVCTSDGFTYERTAITKWLRTKDTSPSTGAMLESKKLIPNILVRSMIRRQ